MADPPPTAAWRHLDARVGFEVVFLRREADGYAVEGHSTAVEDGEAWSIGYTLTVDSRWRTRSAHVVGQSAVGAHEVRLEGDGTGEWRVDGRAAPQLAGCVDVDLEACVFTNALPVHRLRLEVGQRAEAPAAYVRALDLRGSAWSNAMPDWRTMVNTGATTTKRPPSTTGASSSTTRLASSSPIRASRCGWPRPLRDN